MKPVFFATFPDIPEMATDSESRQDVPDKVVDARNQSASR